MIEKRTIFSLAFQRAIKRRIERLIDGKVNKLGHGAYSIAYRSLTNPNDVYICSQCNDPAKEVTNFVDSVHIPKYDTIHDFDYAGEAYCIHKTQYSHKVAGEALKQYDILEHVWFTNGFFDDVITLIRRNDYDGLYTIFADFVEFLQQHTDLGLEESIIDALSTLYTWATAYGPNFTFDLHPANVAMDDQGNLILRDVLHYVVKQRRI